MSAGLGAHALELLSEAASAEAEPHFVLKGTIASNQPLLLVDQQGVVINRARTEGEAATAVAALLTGFAAPDSEPRIRARCVMTDHGLSVLEAPFGRLVAALIPRWNRSTATTLGASVEFGLDEAGHARVPDLSADPVSIHQLVVQGTPVEPEQRIYLAAARLGAGLVHEGQDRMETLRRVALAAEQTTTVATIAIPDAAELAETISG